MTLVSLAELATILHLLIQLLLWPPAVLLALLLVLARYSQAARDPACLDHPLRLPRLLRDLSLAGLEYLCCLLNLLLFPLGCLPPTRWRHRPKRRTLILLHGLYFNRASLFWLQLRLRLHGLRVITPAFSLWHNIESLTEALDHQISALRLEQGVEQVDLLGYGFGGLILRNYVQRRGGANHIRQAICLGCAHQGSDLAVFAPTRLARHLRRNDPLLIELNRLPWPPQVSLASIRAADDLLIQPPEAARLPLGQDMVIANCGHLLLLYHPATFSALQQILVGGAPVTAPEQATTNQRSLPAN